MDATGFTTIHLKSNFTGICPGGSIPADAIRIHAGRSTQVWAASVTDESNTKKIALLPCTRVILYKL